MFYRTLGRYGRPWGSLLGDMERLHRQMGRLIDDDGRGRGEMPPVNIWTSEDKAVLTAEIPGVDPDDLDISVVGNTLTLRGERKAEDGERTWFRRERETGAFARTFELPFAVDAEGVEATFARGVLELSLPRAEADKPRKITVKRG